MADAADRRFCVPAQRPSRRGVIGGLGATAVAGGLGAADAAFGQFRRRDAGLAYDVPATVPDTGLDLAPTPACASGDADPTRRQTEGPYYSPDTPPRVDFMEDGAGVPLVILGRVLSTRCEPLPHAVLDFWHADADGRYDNAGYRFRGHQFADADGLFTLATIQPGGYGYASAARPPHIHVKVQHVNVQGPASGLLTTQLYFPDARNARDRIFRESLVMEMAEENGVLTGRFDFVLPTA